MTAPVTVTPADYALLQALDVPASADVLLIAAFHRQQAEAASNAQIAELQEACGGVDSLLSLVAAGCIEGLPYPELMQQRAKAFCDALARATAPDAGGPNA